MTQNRLAQTVFGVEFKNPVIAASGTFGFVEEYNEAFVKEFMPYLIADKQGRTVADLILPKFNNAIGNIRDDGEQLFLGDKTDNE